MPPLQRGPCRVVVLVDTSKSMSSRWPELAHQYIPALLDALPNAKEDGADVCVSIVPIRDGPEQTPGFMRFLDKRTQVQNLYNAGFGPEVSEHAIWRGFERGIKLLCQPGDTSMKYLIVALTSFPGSASAEAGSSSPIPPPWEGFAQRLVQYDIRMTIIMEPVRSYKAVNDFFKTVLTQQRRQFTSPWFAYNARLHHFLISGFSKRSIIRERSKGGTTGTAPSVGPRGARLDPLGMPAGTSSQRSPVDISDILIDKNSRRLGLVEELRRRTGFWPAGADLPGGEGPSPKSRSSASVRGVQVAQPKKRSKERGERISPDSVGPSGPLQDFPVFMQPGPSPSGPSSTISTHGSDHTAHDWPRAQLSGSGPPMSSPYGHVLIPSANPGPGPGANHQFASGYSSIQQPGFSVYQPSPPAPSFNQPPVFASPPPGPSSFHSAGSSMYYNPSAGIPGSGQPPPRAPYRPLSPSHRRPPPPMHASGPSGYRTSPVQDPSLDGGFRFDPLVHVPPQFLSRHEDSSLYGWDGKR